MIPGPRIPAASQALTGGILLSLAFSGLASAQGLRSWQDLSQQSRPQAVSLLSITPMIVPGNQHTCALDPFGAVTCWGRNLYGQLGNGTTTNSSLPVPVSGLGANVAAISGSGDHECALTTSGGVKCWGHNDWGQLGDFTQSDRSTPVDVMNLTSGVIAISAGDQHTCALLSSGGVQCWGYNYYGEVGNGTDHNAWLGAVDVTGLGSGVASISAGGTHSCAVLTTGALKCWGNNFNGQLGIGSAPPDASVYNSDPCPTQIQNQAKCISVPVTVPGLSSGIAAADAGGAETCALTTGGGLKCWGYNAFGQMGNGTTSTTSPNYPQPSPVDVLGLSSGVTALGAGDSPCALKTSGGIQCWGLNDVGQVGDGTTTTRTAPVGVAGLSTGVTWIGAGGRHNCARLSTGVMKCWGWNFYGQLGNGVPTGQFVANPFPVDVAKSGLVVSSIEFKHQHYPQGNYVFIPVEGTTDGNLVQVIATIANHNATDQQIQVQLRDSATGQLLPGNPVNATVPAGGSVPVPYVTDTTGYAWKDHFPLGPRQIGVVVTQGGSEVASNVKALKVNPRPVILVHGFLSNFGTWSTYAGFLETARPGWKAFAVGDGQEPGVMNTGSYSTLTLPTNTILQNAAVLGTYIEGVRTDHDAWHVDIVAHSMGGLISRRYIQNFMPESGDSNSVVSHLVMLGTPNRGTNCALAGDIPIPAVQELRNDYIDLVFNNEVTDQRGVPFSVLAGDPLPFTCFAPVTGDLVVSTISAHRDYTDFQTLSIVHTSMTSSQEVFDTFVQLHVSAGPPPPSSSASLLRSQPSTVEGVPQLLSTGVIQLPASGTIDTPIPVPAGSAFTVSLMAPSTVTSTLKDPSANTVGSIASGSPEAAQPFRTFRVASPATGTWTLHLVNDVSAAVGVPYTAAIEGNPVSLTLSVGVPAANGSMPLTGTLTNASVAVTGATVTATLAGASGQQAPVSLFDDGLHGDGAASDGVYGGTSVPESPGVYGITLVATAPGISRVAKGTVEVKPAAPTTSNPANQSVCAGASAAFSVTASGQPPLSYRWRKNGSPLFDGGGISGAATATLSITPTIGSDSGNYDVVVSDEFAQSATSAAAALAVNPLPSAAISAPSAVCPSAQGMSASVPSAGPGATYAWSIANGSITAGAGTATITFSAGSTGSVQLNVTVTDSRACGASDGKTISIAPGACGSGYHTLTPCRVADTRDASGPSGGPALAANAARTFPVANLCQIPATAKAVAINLAVFFPDSDGDLRVYPAGGAVPLASAINFRAGIVRANNAVVPLGAGGQISVQCDMASPTGSTHFFFDVFGYFE